MRFLLALVIFFNMVPLFAQSQISTQIFDVDMGRAGEEPLIFLTTGQVVKYPKGNKSSFDVLKTAVSKKTWYLITLNSEREIIAFEEIPAPIKPSPITNINKSLFEEEAPPYTPSILKDMNQARILFYEGRTDARKESQCYNRAHVWAYEWRTKKNIYSSKTWLFFTRRYIRKYKFEWWFHVAPSVHVVENGAVRERIMDIKYARGPVKLKTWTDIFLRDLADCPVVQKYSDHANYPESGSCFVMKSSMYYYQPVDLEQLELKGTSRTRWLQPEVKHAYEEAYETAI